jgi:hypothetical protein
MTGRIKRSCQACGQIMLRDEPDEAHTAEDCREWARGSASMKPLLAVALKQALHWALIDSAAVHDPDNADCTDGTRLPTPEEREAWGWDLYAIPLSHIDPGALAQNLAVRLLGSGGWFLGGEYTGNMSPREVFEASVDRPDQDEVAETAFDLGLRLDGS